MEQHTAYDTLATGQRRACETETIRRAPPPKRGDAIDELRASIAGANRQMDQHLLADAETEACLLDLVRDMLTYAELDAPEYARAERTLKAAGIEWRYS